MIDHKESYIVHISELSSMQNTEELTVSWGTKDKLGEREVYQTWCHSGDEKFKQVSNTHRVSPGCREHSC